MKSKKAFEIQFNWIFVLIAGAAILAFFGAAIVKQKNAATASTNIEILNEMERIISSASTTTDTKVPIDTPETAIMVSCNEFSIGAISKQHQNMILFSPSVIKGSKIMTQTLPFREPYKSANMLYATSTQARYIIIGNEDTAKEINKTMPAELSKDFFDSYDASKIKNTNNYKVRFIVVNSNLPLEAPSSLSRMEDADLTALKITGDLEKGELDFYTKKGSSFALLGSTSYIGKSSLIGSIYTDSIELYKCNMRNAFSRHALVTKVHKGKLTELSDSYPRQECLQIYTNAMPYLNSIEATSEYLSMSPNFGIVDMAKLKEAAQSILIQNKESQKFSCPLIY